jgi:hypothetical protein
MAYLFQHWLERWENDPKFNGKFNGKRTLQKHESEVLLEMFMKPLVNLDANWFEQMAKAARAVRTWKVCGSVRKIYEALTWPDPCIYYPAPTFNQYLTHVEKKTGEVVEPESLRKIIRALGLPLSPDKKGRKKTPALKPNKTA